MQSVIDFIQTYWTYISAGILILIEVLILFLKKRPKTLDDFTHYLAQCLYHLPQFINDCEVPGHGDEKKNYVLAQAIGYMQVALGRGLSFSENRIVEENVLKQIEIVLSTPQKKGAQNVAKKS